NYNKQLDFEHLAGYMNLNRDYVCALFKKVTNQSITRYLIGIRIKKAKELLLNTNFNMNSICLEVGIENEQYFCKLFKKYEGISPNQYRSLYWRGL
ncbi:MAG: helix-turn-helix transcriptional regulator, partial [Clostridiales bacterium]|nr:helix-turn-helix transcriptional regulator [Clostridiales bacterium]